MVSAAGKSSMQQRGSDVAFTEIWTAARTMISPVFAEDKPFIDRIVTVLNLTVKITKWMAWALLSEDIISIAYQGSDSYLIELRLSLPAFNLLYLCSFHSSLFLSFFFLELDRKSVV